MPLALLIIAAAFVGSCLIGLVLHRVGKLSILLWTIAILGLSLFFALSLPDSHFLTEPGKIYASSVAGAVLAACVLFLVRPRLDRAVALSELHTTKEAS